LIKRNNNSNSSHIPSKAPLPALTTAQTKQPSLLDPAKYKYTNLHCKQKCGEPKLKIINV